MGKDAVIWRNLAAASWALMSYSILTPVVPLGLQTLNEVLESEFNGAPEGPAYIRHPICHNR